MPEVCFTIFQFPYRGPTPEVVPVNVFGNVNEYCEWEVTVKYRYGVNIRVKKKQIYIPQNITIP